MTSEQIQLEIRCGRFTNSELNDIGRAIQFARARLAQEVKRELAPGAKVFFKGRQGNLVMGTVESVKIKNAIVGTATGRYRVPCNMLELA